MLALGMMRTAYFGINALILLGIHTVAFFLDLADVFPYTRTLFFPLFSLMPLMMGAVGWYEKDKQKWPAILATVIAFGMLVFWVVLLVSRLQARV
jgi:hypothetical protein